MNKLIGGNMRIMKCNSVLLMLDHFKRENHENNKALIENGEGSRNTNWEDVVIPVKDIIEFMEYRIGKE